MKESPILFSVEMIRAILDGQKTITRRVIKPQPDVQGWQHATLQPDSFGTWSYPAGAGGRWKCPYGRSGDGLWVREAWRVGAWSVNNGGFAVDYKADNSCRKEWLHCEDDNVWMRLWKQSTYDAIKMFGSGDQTWEPGKSPCRWRPSIFMPRWASRIALEIVSVRVERLREISRDDCVREGLPPITCGDPERAMRVKFSTLWDSINTNRECGWDLDPWVWVIEFKRIHE